MTAGGTASLWDLDGGERIRTLAGNRAFPIAFSPDGDLVAGGSWDGSVFVWDADTGARALVLPQVHPGGVLGIAFSPDGARLATLGSDGVPRVWAMDLDDLIDIAGRELTRSFADEECRQYLHAARCSSDW